MNSLLSSLALALSPVRTASPSDAVGHMSAANPNATISRKGRELSIRDFPLLDKTDARRRFTNHDKRAWAGATVCGGTGPPRLWDCATGLEPVRRADRGSVR